MESFLLGSWAGGALCYAMVLSAGRRPLPLMQVICGAFLWPLAIALVMVCPEGE